MVIWSEVKSKMEHSKCELFQLVFTATAVNFKEAFLVDKICMYLLSKGFLVY